MIDIKKVQETAQAEVKEEQLKAATQKVKDKLKSLDNAKKVVRNIERELEDLYVELGE